LKNSGLHLEAKIESLTDSEGGLTGVWLEMHMVAKIVPT
jgi:hypothetical protein